MPEFGDNPLVNFVFNCDCVFGVPYVWCFQASFNLYYNIFMKINLLRVMYMVQVYLGPCHESFWRTVDGCNFIVIIWGHSFSTYGKFSKEKKTFLTHWKTRRCAYQWVRNVTFSENFAYVLNEWLLHKFQNTLLHCYFSKLEFP